MENRGQVKILSFILLILILGFSMLVYSAPEEEKITREYTPATSRICKEGKCNLVLYSGIKYIYEDGIWKDRKDARSFRNSDIECKVIPDGVNLAECLDWNETTRLIRFSDIELNKDIPLRKYTLEFNKTTNLLERKYDYFVINLRFDSGLNKEHTLLVKATPDEIIEFGQHSTEIKLQDADIENLEDAFIQEDYPDTNYASHFGMGAGVSNENKDRWFYIKFNISEVPSNSIIDSSTLYLYCYETCTNNPANLHELNNQTWVETYPTWNKKVQGTGSQISSDTGSSTPYWFKLNAASWVSSEYNLGNKNVSFTVKGSSSLNTVWYGYTKEYSVDTSKRPYLNITYSPSNQPPVINLQAPANNSEFTPGSLEFIYNVTDPEGDIVENCSLWLNKNETGFELDQTDSSITQAINQSFTKSLTTGNYTWKVSCYDNNTNLGSSEIRNLIIFGINNPPTIDIPSISPDPSYTDSQLQCTVKAYDVDLGSIIVKFDWYNNSIYIATENITTSNGTSVTSILTSGIQNKNEVWNCTVRAFDGQNYSDYQSDIITISNSMPTHSAPSLKSTYYYNATNENLTCYNQSTLDLDNDKVTNIYSWFVNNAPFAVLSLPFEINADDYSGSGNDGARYGTAFTAGKYGNALEFDGSDDYIDLGNSESLSQNFNALTVEAWVKPETRASSVTNPMIISKYYAWNLHINYNNNGFVFAFNDGGGWSTDSVAYSAALSAGNWYHVIGRYDGSTCKIFVNGNEAASSSCNGNIITNANMVKIGQWNNNEWFNGSIDEVRVYSRALSQNEIREHYNLNYNKLVSDETSINEIWKCKVTPNDGSTDGSLLESNTITIQPNVYDITFNITEGEYGNSLTGVMIACDNGWSVSSTSSNPYGPVKFYEGSYNCELSYPYVEYYNKTIIFIADGSKQINVVMSKSGFLSVEEHSMLDWLYRCWKEGDCWNLLNNINQTTTNIWDQFKPTDESVVLQENIISNTLSSAQNITINYTIKVPPKAGYSDGDWLPIRIAFWFLDENNQSCLDQDKQTDTNRAEKTYCIPLIAETLGRINQNTNFRVDLRPNLPAGNYEIVRDIEIDPNQVWIKYGQEIIDKVKVSESNSNPNIFVIKQEIPQPEENFEDLTTEPQVQESSGLTYVTSPTTSDTNTAKNIIQNVQRLLSGSQIVSIIAIVCGSLTIVVICFTVYKIKDKKKA